MDSFNVGQTRVIPLQAMIAVPPICVTSFCIDISKDNTHTDITHSFKPTVNACAQSTIL